VALHWRLVHVRMLDMLPWLELRIESWKLRIGHRAQSRRFLRWPLMLLHVLGGITEWFCMWDTWRWPFCSLDTGKGRDVAGYGIMPGVRLRHRTGMAGGHLLTRIGEIWRVPYLRGL
jgi:hypothetical protein